MIAFAEIGTRIGAIPATAVVTTERACFGRRPLIILTGFDFFTVALGLIQFCAFFACPVVTTFVTSFFVPGRVIEQAFHELITIAIERIGCGAVPAPAVVTTERACLSRRPLIIFTSLDILTAALGII